MSRFHPTCDSSQTPIRISIHKAFKILALTSCAALLSMTVHPVHADEASARLSPAELQQANAIHQEAMRKAAQTAEAKRLREHLETCEILLAASRRDVEQWGRGGYGRFGQPRYRRRGGIAGIAESYGNLAAQETAKRQTLQNKRAVVRATDKLNTYLVATAWKSMSPDERELCARALPDFARQAAGTDQVPDEREGSRPESWIRIQPENASFSLWLPARPEHEPRDRAYRLNDPTTQTEYLFLTVDLGRNGAVLPQLPGLARKLAEGLAESVGGTLRSSQPCRLLGTDGHNVEFSYTKNGAEMVSESRIVLRDSVIATFSIVRTAENQDSAEADWFFNSIKPL